MEDRIEKWVDIQNFEGLYQVSNLGRVKSVSRNVDKVLQDNRTISKKVNERMLKPGVNKAGYSIVSLFRSSNGRTMTVHRLVAMGFHTIDPVRTLVNHKDGIKTNNHVNNLEWCTRNENAKHAYVSGLTPKLYGGNTSRAMGVININTGEEFPTIKIAAYAHGITGRHLGKMLRGDVKNKTFLKLIAS